MDQNLRVVTEANIQRFIERLYVESDDDQRELFQTLLISELRRYETNQDRLAALRWCLRDCEGRILKYRALLDDQKAAGVATDQAQKLLDNLMGVCRIIREYLRQKTQPFADT